MSETSFSPHPLHLVCIYFHQFYSFSLVAWLRVSQSCCMLSFDSLEIISSSFFWIFVDMPIAKKSSKIKFLKKFQKILYKFLCQKWGRETPGRHQVGLPRHLIHRWRGPALAAPPRCERALPGPSLISSSPALSLSRKQRHTQLKPEFLLFFTWIFRSPCSAQHFCWNLEHLFSGMWLLHLSKQIFFWWSISWVF
jgi:hypothetical protein